MRARENNENEGEPAQEEGDSVDAFGALAQSAPTKDTVGAATGAALPYPIPEEVLHMGLTEADLAPFAFDNLETVGRTVLQATMQPPGKDQREVHSHLAGHNMVFSFGHHSPDYSYLKVEVNYEIPYTVTARTQTGEPIETTRVRNVGMESEPKVVFDRPILVGSYSPSEGETAMLVIRLKEM